jgi:hypothetical protein
LIRDTSQNNDEKWYHLLPNSLNFFPPLNSIVSWLVIIHKDKQRKLKRKKINYHYNLPDEYQKQYIIKVPPAIWKTNYLYIKKQINN